MTQLFYGSVVSSSGCSLVNNRITTILRKIRNYLLIFQQENFTTGQVDRKYRTAEF